MSPVYCACPLPHTPEGEEKARIAEARARELRYHNHFVLSAPHDERGEFSDKTGRYWWFRHHSQAEEFALRIGKGSYAVKPFKGSYGPPYSWRVYK